MKATGIVRNLDELGRVVIPKELRKHLGMADRDPLEIYTEADYIILKRYAEICTLCSSTKKLQTIPTTKKKICEDCLADVTLMNAFKGSS